jgi:hypothetical protein
MRHVVVLALVLTGCPPIHSTPCASDDECRADQRCRRGACGPICVDDTECGSAQVCLASGVCGPRPQCARDTDCASGFVCGQGRCQCLDDSVCAANQACLSGTCTTRPRCTADADCLGTGGRCEVTQGLCLPACVVPQDCAPTLDSRLAFALYTCVQGTCTRRCTQDLQCGGQGLICQNGLCTKADCATRADCPAGQLCTSATFGRCEAFTLCTSNADCRRNFECKRYETGQCPPGFDCTQRVCRELPRCLADQDCVSGVPGSMNAQVLGFCEEGHCQPSPTCQTSASCPGGRSCIGGVCVPTVCRGNESCGPGKACVDGACVDQPAPADVNLLRLSPSGGLLVEGDSLQLTALAFRLDGTSAPLTMATFTVTDGLGQPSAAATVAANGLLTAVSPGEVRVRAGVTGSTVTSNEVRFTIIPAVLMGRRVIVVDGATGAPLDGVTVWACPAGDCDAKTEVTTDALGLAPFPLLDDAAVTFTVTAPQLRADGLPAWERASVIGTTATDVLLPLRPNPVRAHAGFNASISFAEVSTSGSYWAGFVAASVSDVPSLTVRDLLGDSFLVELPGVGQRVPVPGALVLYTSPGLGIPQEVKARSLGFAQPGTARYVQAWAGRAQLDSVFSLRSIDFLSYLGAFDFAQQSQVSFVMRPDVADTTDVDGDGLCSNPQRCPMGSEQVPDYANFTPLSFRPGRQQRLRTEVVLPKVPSTFDTILVAPALFEARAGMLPIGFASRTPGQPGADGLRPVEPITVRGGQPSGGLEIATPGLWTLAANAQGTVSSARLLRASPLPERALVTPFLPALANASFAPSTRTLNPGQPAWSSAFSSGAELARAALTGADTRHVIYFPMASGQTAVPWPPTPSGPGQDPAAQAMSALELVAIDLAAGVTFDGLLSPHGVNLLTWALAIDGYSRLDR